MEDRKKKIIILTSTIAVILIIAILLGIKLASLKNNNKTIPVDNNQEINNTIQQENVIENKETENKISNTVNNEIELEQDEGREEITQQKPTEDNNQEVDKETIEKEESNIEKAIRIAEENWKQGGNVKFTYDKIEDGKYIVYVRDAQTHHIATFKIDIDNETFEILQ